MSELDDLDEINLGPDKAGLKQTPNAKRAYKEHKYAVARHVNAKRGFMGQAGRNAKRADAVLRKF